MKCGAILDEAVKDCPKCGIPTESKVIEPERPREDRGSRIFLAVAAIFLGVAIIIAVIFSFPFKPVNISESRDVQYQTDVDTLILDLTADSANIDIAFEDLADKLVTLDVSGTGHVGILSSTDPLHLTFDDAITGNVLTVNSNIDTGFGWFEVTCDIRIDPSLNTSLDIRISSGNIVMSNRAGVVLNSLSLVVTSGNVRTSLAEGVVVADDVYVKATSGNVVFSWNNLNVTNDIQVNVETTSGNVNVDIKQEEELPESITLKAQTTSGNVHFVIEIQGDIGAWIESEVTSGNINIIREDGFGGVKSLLMSDNHPAGSNFVASLETTSGNINIDAKYVP